MSSGERTGVLVLRVWVEAGARTGETVMARITSERDLGSGERLSVPAAGLDEIVEIVRRWVEEFAAHA